MHFLDFLSPSLSLSIYQMADYSMRMALRIVDWRCTNCGEDDPTCTIGFSRCYCCKKHTYIYHRCYQSIFLTSKRNYGNTRGPLRKPAAPTASGGGGGDGDPNENDFDPVLQPLSQQAKE
jgi:hypothetical protein